jgi:hypothetical protein
MNSCNHFQDLIPSYLLWEDYFVVLVSFPDNFPNIFKAIFMLWCPAFCCPDTKVYLAFSALTSGSSSLLITTISLHSIFSPNKWTLPAQITSWCVPNSFKPSVCSWTILLSYHKANFKSSDNNESFRFRLFWLSNMSQTSPPPPPPWLDSPSEPRPPQCWGCETTFRRHNTFGRTPLSEWQARPRNPYLTTSNDHKQQACMPEAEFEPAIPGSGRPKTHLDRLATGIGQRNITDLITGTIQA